MPEELGLAVQKFLSSLLSLFLSSSVNLRVSLASGAWLLIKTIELQVIFFLVRVYTPDIMVISIL